MSLKKEIREEIKREILLFIRNNESPFVILEHYKISRQTIYKYLKEFLEKGIIVKNNKNSYSLNLYIKESFTFKNKNLYEDIIYNNYIKKYENNKKENVIQILTYTFSEMLNNAIDHSESEDISVIYGEDFFNIYVIIEDNGIGIFKKIKRDHNLKNENEAIFELKKGKLTSDSENHSGEGIFFTSKTVDTFIIQSYNKQFSSGEKFFFYSFEQLKEDNIKGTRVSFVIDKSTNREIRNVFDTYTIDEDGIGVFNKTEITVHLAQEYLGFPMVSRSLAKRILSNVDKFKVIFLDFKNIDMIGQGFADEIFRVFRKKNPSITVIPINNNEEVTYMINRALITQI